MTAPAVTIDTKRANTDDAKYGMLLERRNQIIARMRALDSRIMDMQAEYVALRDQLGNVTATIEARADNL